MNLERLEDRLAPAIFADGGISTLTITLGNPGEALAVRVNASGNYEFDSRHTITNGGVTTPGDFSGLARAV